MGFDTIEINLVFSQIRSEGGVIKSQFFPKFKIVYIILGIGEGSRKLPHSAQLENFSSAWNLAILQVGPRSGFIMYQKPPTQLIGCATDPPTHPPPNYLSYSKPYTVSGRSLDGLWMLSRTYSALQSIVIAPPKNFIATLGPTWEFQLCLKSCNLASWATKWLYCVFIKLGKWHK